MCRFGVVFVAAAVAVAASSSAPGAASADPAVLLRQADAPLDAFDEGVIGLRVVVNERGKKPVVNVLQLFVNGPDRSLVVFREGKQKGRKILTLGDRAFLIVPGSSRAIPVSKSQQLMGPASLAAIARLRFSEEYEAVLRPGEEPIGSAGAETSCRVLDLTAKRRGSAYPAAVMWVGRDDGRPRRLLLSLASGKEAKDVRFVRYDDEHRIAAMDIRDLLVPGGDTVTTLAFESYEKRPLDPAIFDPEGARAVP